MADRTRELDAELEQAGFGFCLSTQEVSTVLRIDQKTVRALSRDGQLKASHVGVARAKLRFTRSAVAGYLAACEESEGEE